MPWSFTFLSETTCKSSQSDKHSGPAAIYGKNDIEGGSIVPSPFKRKPNFEIFKKECEEKLLGSRKPRWKEMILGKKDLVLDLLLIAWNSFHQDTVK